MAPDFSGVVLRREEVASHPGREEVASIPSQTAQRDCREKRNRREPSTRHWLGSAYVRFIRIEPAFDQMHQRIAHPSARLLEPIVRPDNLSAGGEDDFHQVHK